MKRNCYSASEYINNGNKYILIGYFCVVTTELAHYKEMAISLKQKQVSVADLCKEMYFSFSNTMSQRKHFYDITMLNFNMIELMWIHLLHLPDLGGGGSSWLWSEGSWIYNYLCNQCISQLSWEFESTFMARCTRCNITWSSLSVTCDKSVVFSEYAGFLHQ